MVHKELKARVLDGAETVTCRPADLLEPELERQTEEFNHIAIERKIRIADDAVDDVLTYALFPQIGIRFLQNRDNPDAFEPPPGAEPPAAPAAAPAASTSGPAVYSVRVNGTEYTVEVAESGELGEVRAAAAAAPAPASGAGQKVAAVLAGNIFKVHVQPGDTVNEGQPLLVVEAMKMETTVSAPKGGTISDVFVREGDVVAVGDPLVVIA